MPTIIGFHTDSTSHAKSEKTVAMVLQSENGHIPTTAGPNRMTQEPKRSQE